MPLGGEGTDEAAVPALDECPGRGRDYSRWFFGSVEG